MNRKWIIVVSTASAWSDEFKRGQDMFFASRPFLEDPSLPPEILEFPAEEKEHEIRSATFEINLQQALEEWDDAVNPPVPLHQANLFDDTPLPDDQELFRG